MGDTYVATETLFVGNHRAHNVGDVVPESNIKRNGWEGKVKGVSAAAAAAPAFDPAQFTADEVNDYLSRANTDERERVLALEREGKGRTTVKGL